MSKDKAKAANIVVDDRAANIFNLMKGALGCRSGELFEEILEFYLTNQFQSRLEERGEMFLSMIEKLKNDRDNPQIHKSVEAKVLLEAQIPEVSKA